MKEPSGAAYVVNGYINDQNLVERVETWVEHDMLGDLHVDANYGDYRDVNGLKVPGKMIQKRGGHTFFDVTVADARPNPANLTELLTPPPPPARAGGPARARRRLAGQAGGLGALRPTRRGAGSLGQARRGRLPDQRRL